MAVSYRNRKTVNSILTVQDIIDYVKENNLDPKTTIVKFFESDSYKANTWGLDSIAIDEDKYNRTSGILVGEDSIFYDWECEL